MKLITEEISSVKFITEGKGAKKKMYIEGVFLQGDIKNRNGRMYPVNTLAKEVGRYNESFVQKGRRSDRDWETPSIYIFFLAPFPSDKFNG